MRPQSSTEGGRGPHGTGRRADRGTGQIDQGSIGYWLKPEFTTDVTHEPGVVGAVHTAEEDVSGCKFYINLTKAPVLDGNYTVFGKVAAGLEVAAQIRSAPIRQD